MKHLIRIPQTLAQWQAKAISYTDHFVEFQTVEMDTCEIADIIDTLPMTLRAARDSDGDYFVSTPDNLLFIPSELAIRIRFKLGIK